MTSPDSPYREMFGAVWVEAANARGIKSSRSGGQPQHCVLCTVGSDGLVGIQDSKLNEEIRKERTLIFTPSEMKAFILGVKDGEFDYLIDCSIPRPEEADEASLFDVAAVQSTSDQSISGGASS